MHDDEDGGVESDGVESDGDSSAHLSAEARPDDLTEARRAIIKKAAAGAAVAGAAWMAPRVDGLSLVPDYASAATLTGTVSTTHNFVWRRLDYDPNDGCWDPAGDWPGQDFWSLNPGPAGAGDTMNQAITRTVNVPGQGDVSVTLNSGTTADSGANVPGSINFSGWDPPFNKITGGNLVYRTRGPGESNSTDGPYTAPLASYITLPAPTNTPITFDIPEAANNQGASPSGDAQWSELSFQFNFGPG